jgi:cytochrome c oxidase assembly protein subunit 15
VNRAVTGAVSLAVIGAVLGSLLREPRRRDLVAGSVGMVLGVIAQIVLGGYTVKHRLDPRFVMAHFLLSAALLANAVWLHHRAGEGTGEPRAVMGSRDVGAARLAGVLAAAVLTAGTFVTGSGPHSGDKYVRRLNFSPHRVTQIHGALAMTLAVVALVMLARTARPGTPPPVRRASQWLVEALAAQIAIGYLQYFTGVPALLVGFHLLGASLVWMAVLHLNLVMRVRTVETPAPAEGARTQLARA